MRHPRPRRHVDGAACSAPRPSMRDGRRPGRRALRRGVRARPTVDRQDVAWRVVGRRPRAVHRAAAARRRARCACSAGWPRPASSDEVDPAARRPEWMKVRARFDDEYLELKQLVRDLDLHTVCEEAGCPNIYECWADRTATFMILGDRCTRACGFCLVDTRKPLAGRRRRAAPRRRRGARARPRARRDHVRRARRPADGGASVFAATVDAVRAASPGTAVELLISDCKGDDASLATIFAARPDVLNHNLETVARLQRAGAPVGRLRAVARRCSARAKDAGLVTKSGLILGMGETADEVRGALADLARGRRRHRHARPVPAADARSTCRSRAGGRPPSSTRSGPTPRRWASRTSRPGPLVRSSYHAREGIDQHGRRARPDDTGVRGRAVRFDLRRSRRVVGRAADVLRRDRAERRRRARQPARPRASTRCAILGPTRVAYLDLTGSGVETIAHLRDNGRITLMACAFTGAPRISRIYGAGTVHELGSPGSTSSPPNFPELPGPPGDHRRRRRPRHHVVRVRGAADGPRRRIATACSTGRAPRVTTGSSSTGRRRTRASIDGLPGPRPA